MLGHYGTSVYLNIFGYFMSPFNGNLSKCRKFQARMFWNRQQEGYVCATSGPEVYTEKNQTGGRLNILPVPHPRFLE